MMRYAINYGAVMGCLIGSPSARVIEGLGRALPPLWCEAYETMPGSGGEIVAVEQGSYTYLFDLVAERVVVAYGLSAKAVGKRDASRMRGFLGRMSDRFAGRGDKGHIMSHAQGGGMDINLFPQRADINRGRSLQGRLYREMERACAANPGSFCFSRLLYDDPSWVPHEIEYGVLHHPTQFRIERFTNAPA
jgi:hypothetical protein